jgi:hypothetical protein
LEHKEHKDQLGMDLEKTLTVGEMASSDPERAAVELLPPKYEVRIRAERDPVAEETVEIRKTVKEVDGRYDAY